MGDQPTTLQEKLIRARERRGWTLYRAWNRMPRMRDVVLRTLEGRNISREPAPGERAQLRTVIDIVEAYWPDIQLEDFDPTTRLRLVPRDDAAARELEHGDLEHAAKDSAA